jgi:hypothetical protein
VLSSQISDIKLAPVFESEIKRIFENDPEIFNDKLLWTRLLTFGAAFGESAEGLTHPSGKGPWIISLIYGTVRQPMRVMKRTLAQLSGLEAYRCSR